MDTLGFPGRVKEQYTLLEVWAGSGEHSAFLMEDKATRERVLVKFISSDEEYAHLLKMADTHLDHVPEILAMDAPQKGKRGYYLYSAPSGETLFQLLEHENPLGADASRKIIREMHAISEDLHENGFVHGNLTAHSFALTSKGIELIDLGNGTVLESDENRIRRIGFRLLKGRWPNDQEEAALSDKTLNQLMHEEKTGKKPAHASSARLSPESARLAEGRKNIMLPVLAGIAVIAAAGILLAWFFLFRNKEPSPDSGSTAIATEAETKESETKKQDGTEKTDSAEKTDSEEKDTEKNGFTIDFEYASGEAPGVPVPVTVPGNLPDTVPAGPNDTIRPGDNGMPDEGSIEGLKEEIQTILHDNEMPIGAQ